MSVDVGATTRTSVLDQYKLKDTAKTKELGKDQFLQLLVKGHCVLYSLLGMKFGGKGYLE